MQVAREDGVKSIAGLPGTSPVRSATSVELDQAVQGQSGRPQPG